MKELACRAGGGALPLGEHQTPRGRAGRACSGAAGRGGTTVRGARVRRWVTEVLGSGGPEPLAFTL